MQCAIVASHVIVVCITRIATRSKASVVPMPPSINNTRSARNSFETAGRNVVANENRNPLRVLNENIWFTMSWHRPLPTATSFPPGSRCFIFEMLIRDHYACSWHTDRPFSDPLPDQTILVSPSIAFSRPKLSSKFRQGVKEISKFWQPYWQSGIIFEIFHEFSISNLRSLKKREFLNWDNFYNQFVTNITNSN